MPKVRGAKPTRCNRGRLSPAPIRKSVTVNACRAIPASAVQGGGEVGEEAMEAGGGDEGEDEGGDLRPFMGLVQQREGQG